MLENMGSPVAKAYQNAQNGKASKEDLGRCYEALNTEFHRRLYISSYELLEYGLSPKDTLAAIYGRNREMDDFPLTETEMDIYLLGRALNSFTCSLNYLKTNLETLKKEGITKDALTPEDCEKLSYKLSEREAQISRLLQKLGVNDCSPKVTDEIIAV